MKKIIIIGLLIAAVIATFVSPLASKHPDGLEKVAENKGFLQKAEGENVIKAPIPDYSMPGIKNKTIAGSVAGLTGVILVFMLVYGIGHCIRSKGQKVGRSEGRKVER